MSSSNKTDSDTASYAKSWELNIYELNRMPHEITYDDTEIAVSPKVLQNELMCPICLDILKNTMTTKECLHRFCHDCIITALRAGNKECPTCRKKLVSKRSLRPDPNFDGIISKIYPNREEYDALHEKVLEKLNKKHLTAIGGLNSSSSKVKSRKSIAANNATSSSANGQTSDLLNENTNESTQATNAISNLKLNDHNGKTTAKRAITNSDESDMESQASTEQSSLQMQNETDEIEIILKPHPLKEQSLTAKRFLKTTSNATINHLSKYLFTRLCVEANQLENANNEQSITDFQLYISSNEKSKNSFQHLNQNLPLESVIEKYWKLNRPVELFYVYKSGNSTIVTTNSNGTASAPCSSGLNENGNSNSCSSVSSNTSS